MNIATWNVNSVRTRQAHIVQWLTANPVDVLCLQETKVVDDDFPRQGFEEMGYHCYISGQKAYNGVALLTKAPLDSVQVGFAPVLGDRDRDLDEQKRVILGQYSTLQILNLYVPNGSEIGSDKYQYKLRWLSALREYVQHLLATGDQSPPQLLICGDFNIALDDLDIYDPTNRERHIMASDQERSALEAIVQLGFHDAFRKFTPEGGHYSWWDYRTRAFRDNRGWRIDHIYLTPPLYDRATACTIDSTPRALEKPSDHAPVVVELSL